MCISHSEFVHLLFCICEFLILYFSISFSAFLLLLSLSFPPIKYQLRSVLQSPLVFVKVSKAQNCLTEAWPLSDGKPDDGDGGDDDEDDDDSELRSQTVVHTCCNPCVGAHQTLCHPRRPAHRDQPRNILYFSALPNCISPLCQTVFLRSALETVFLRCAQTYLSCAQFPNYCLINKKEQNSISEKRKGLSLQLASRQHKLGILAV